MAGGASGGAFMGQSFRMLAAGMSDALGLLQRLGSIGHGRLRSGDVPLLIRALSIPTGGVDLEARRALTALAGRDLGGESGPWLEWWRRRGAELRDRQAASAAAGALFARLRECVLTGRWIEVGELLSERMRRAVPAGELGRVMAASAAALRRAYRESRFAGLRAAGRRGTLAVDWGEEGFEFRELPLVRETGGWRLDALPWGRRLVRMAPRKVETNRQLTQLRPRGRPSVFTAGCSPVALLATLLALAIPAALWRLHWSGLQIPEWLGLAIAAGITGAIVLYFPATLIYHVYLRPLPNSRQLRERLPEARRLRD